MLHFNLSENFDCYTKISTQKNMLIFSYCLDKNNSFGYFGVMQKNKKNANFKFSFWRLFFEVKGKYLQI